MNLLSGDQKIWSAPDGHSVGSRQCPRVERIDRADPQLTAAAWPLTKARYRPSGETAKLVITDFSGGATWKRTLCRAGGVSRK